MFTKIPKPQLHWPSSLSEKRKYLVRITIVTVNFNTKKYISYLIFSLYRILGKRAFHKILVIDNGSCDGSLSMLLELEKHNLIELIVNKENKYHGPALNQALIYLSAQMKKENNMNYKDYIWILDSDIIILRKDILKKSLECFYQNNAAIIGEFEFYTKSEGYAQLYSLLIDPQLIWQRSMPIFINGGAPCKTIQEACRKKRIHIIHFPFCEHLFILHFSAGTLLNLIAKKKMHSNIYYNWARIWQPLGFKNHWNRLQEYNYRQFLKLFHHEIPELNSKNLIISLKRKTLLNIDLNCINYADKTCI